MEREVKEKGFIDWALCATCESKFWFEHDGKTLPVNCYTCLGQKKSDRVEQAYLDLANQADEPLAFTPDDEVPLDSVLAAYIEFAEALAIVKEVDGD